MSPTIVIFQTYLLKNIITVIQVLFEFLKNYINFIRDIFLWLKTRSQALCFYDVAIILPDILPHLISLWYSSTISFFATISLKIILIYRELKPLETFVQVCSQDNRNKFQQQRFDCLILIFPNTWTELIDHVDSIWMANYINTEFNSNINVRWKKIGQPISDRHFHYLSH